MEIKEIKNNLFKLDDDNNDIVLNSLNIAIKSYFCSYASVREQFDKRTYHETYSKDYYENFSETILHFHHFFELLLKELLKNEHKLLPIDITRESKVLVKLITNKPLEDNEKLNNNTLAFKSLLDRTCKLISLEPNIHFGFIKNHKASLDLLNDIRNGIWHKGENMLTYEAYDYLIGKYILPLAVKFLKCSNYMEKYKKTQLWVFKGNSIKINPLELIIKEFEKEKIDIGKVAVLKELGRASYYSHYGKVFGTFVEQKNKIAYQLAKAELVNGFESTNAILNCPCCGAESLVTYYSDEITYSEEHMIEDENGYIQTCNTIAGNQYIDKVKCPNCTFQLNKKGLKNLKEYGFDVEDYWIIIKEY
ncbi:hypothetical protein RCG47_02890 [Staphylococcus simulans]|uniref:hypothetical protein n=1 Tax=Staphylococcus simulans TaxID=1286 RepID=UPI00280BAB9C|nr:hypothetical protein [Staphylococcus simulans]WMM11132.1 hypothetical protein RCG47_02890 [Staphylococcus simulans]